jgi:tetratricopeptide (TPR) repeat protein
MDPTVVVAIIGGVAAIITALIGAWATLHPKSPKPDKVIKEPSVDDIRAPSSTVPDLNERGLAAYTQGQYPEALNYFQQALVIAREVGNRAGEGTTLNNIGLVYQAQGRYDQALQNYQQALVVSREIGNRAGEGTTLNNIGAVYEAQGRYDQALQNFQQALVVSREIGDRALEETVRTNIESLPDN